MRDRTTLDAAYARLRTAMALTMVFSFFVNLLMFVGPLYMMQIYDRVLSSRNEYTLVAITIIAVALLVSYALLDAVRGRLLNRASLQFDDILASDTFKRVVRRQIAQPGGSAYVALQDIDRVREFIGGHGIIAFFDAPWVPLFLAMCFLFHPLLGVVATTGAVLIFALALANELTTRRALRDASQSGQAASHFANATMQNAEVIRAMGMEQALGDKWLEQHDIMLAHQSRAMGRAGTIMAASKFVRMTLQIAILGVGAWLALGGYISPGLMIAASIMMGRALAPVEQAVSQWKQFVGARQAHIRLKQLFDVAAEKANRVQLPDPKGQLTAEGLVAFAPGTRNSLLKGVSFGIEAGETLAVVGLSGSGKSTLVRHLVGASQPASGAIRLDGAELAHWDADQLGHGLGYLPQDVKLFRGSVAANIARFRPGATDAEIVKAAQLAGAHEMIQKLPEGYATEIGDGGQNLSGGQRQRLGLARAVFGGPCLVILDEPNSNLDEQGEVALGRCIQQLRAMKTSVIVVTHKKNLLGQADKILVLNDGAVAKFGPTQEVLSAPQSARQAPRPAGAIVSMANPT